MWYNYYMVLKYIIDEEKILVKEYLEKIGLSRKLRKRARIEDVIYINGVLSKNYYELHKGDELKIIFDESINEQILTNEKNINILYEDEYFMIIEKENNMSSQPSQKHPMNNVISCLKQYFINNNINSNIHLVNRLDYSTSGLMIIAKDGITHFEFSKIKIVKKYLCQIEGHIDPKNGTIDLPIARYDAPSIKRYVCSDGKQSITHYKVIDQEFDSDYLEVTLETGRTHQIRVHLSYLGHPLIGDELYGNKADELKLHCYYLKFKHPWNDKEIEIRNYPNWIRRNLCQI